MCSSYPKCAQCDIYVQFQLHTIHVTLSTLWVWLHFCCDIWQHCGDFWQLNRWLLAAILEDKTTFSRINLIHPWLPSHSSERKGHSEDSNHHSIWALRISPFGQPMFLGQYSSRPQLCISRGAPNFFGLWAPCWTSRLGMSSSYTYENFHNQRLIH